MFMCALGPKVAAWRNLHQVGPSLQPHVPCCMEVDKCVHGWTCILEGRRGMGWESEEREILEWLLSFYEWLCWSVTLAKSSSFFPHHSALRQRHLKMLFQYCTKAEQQSQRVRKEKKKKKQYELKFESWLRHLLAGRSCYCLSPTDIQ